MEYVNLECYANRALELKRGDHGLKPHRLAAEQDRLAREMQRILKPSIRRLAARKNMTRDLQDDIDQHTYIAIYRALQDWDPTIATFSTHVHWKVRAELQTLQHFEFPDRRRLSVPVRVSFVELDRPLSRGDDENGGTLADMMVDETAHDDVEASARRHVAFHALERAFSHYVARQMRTYCASQKDEARIAKKRHGLMRNRWIYIRRTLHLETYETIAQEYGVTRERTRQIIIKIEEDMKGQLPRFSKEDDAVVEATARPPEDIHESWDYMLADYFMETGEDTRLLNREAPMPTRPGDYDFRPVVLVESQTVEAMQAEFARDIDAPAYVEQIPLDLGEVANDDQPGARVLSITTGVKRRARRAAMTLGAGAMMMAAVAANAQSRAIPPEVEAAKPAPAQSGRAAVAAATPTRAVTRRAATPVLVDMARIVMSRPAWGVRVADFASEREARSGWQKESRGWAWLKGLRPAHVADAASGVHAVAFGPLTQAQADGMCLEARRYARPCSVVRFGVERQASAAVPRRPA